MSDPYTISGERRLISQPTQSWEKVGSPPAVNEGPTALVSGSNVNIIYSASGSWMDDYCLGRLTCTGDPYTATFTKTGPVFSKFGNVYGPGHASFVQSPDANKWWIVYHAAKFSGSGWDRNIRTQQFSFEGDTPNFGVPVEPGAPLRVPSNNDARPFTVGNIYKIQFAGNTGVCIDVPSGQTGEQIQLYTNNGATAQKWKLLDGGDNVYYLFEPQSTVGTRMDNSGSSLNVGNPIITWADNGNDAQKWRIEDMGNGQYKIVNKKSNLALDDPYGNGLVGDKLQQYQDNGYTAQR